jgi:RimJ/RimL family protein N-acetyltransferase
MAIEIRPITPDDIEGFHRAVDVVARERKYLAFLEPPPLTSAREFVLENIAKGNPQFVAVADDDVVGWCDVVRLSRPIHAHAGVLGMGMLPAYRGRGYGRKLIETTLHAAQLAGFRRVELAVHADNPRAIALYERIGFVREGIKRRATCIDGRFGDAIMMAITELEIHYAKNIQSTGDGAASFTLQSRR